MEWIRGNKLALWAVVAASLLAIAYSLSFGKSVRGEALRPSQFGWATLPWILLPAAGIPLVYEKWFGGPSPGPLFVFRRVMFWLFMSFALALFFALYGIFIFRVW